MAPAEFDLRLQKGIVGGFAPPIPDAIHTLSKTSAQAHVNVLSAVRLDGQPEAQPAAPKQVQHDDDTSKLVEELESILKELPTEQPPGSEDIYGLNTGIAFQTADFQWYNGGPQGCGGGESFVKPTEEQKAQFKRAVEIVEQIVSKSE